VNEAAFIPSGYRRLSLSFLNLSFSLVVKFKRNFSEKNYATEMYFFKIILNE